MGLPITDRINVRGIDYTEDYELEEGIVEDSDKLAASDDVYNTVMESINVTVDGLQPKELTAPVTVDGTEIGTVEGAIQALTNNTTTSPASGSSKFFTAGGAYSDKTSSPSSGSIKNLKANGAFLDKSDVPVYNSSKNLTAKGAFDNKTMDIIEGSNKNITARGVISDTTGNFTEGFQKSMRSGAMYYVFNGMTNSRDWLGRVFGRRLCNTWHQATIDIQAGMAHVGFANGIFVCTANINNSKPFWSEDGKTWQEGVITSGDTLGSYAEVVYLNGKWFVYKQNSGNVYVSNDGKSWQTLSIVKNCNGIAFLNDIWVFTRYASTSIYWSDDLVTFHDGTYEGSAAFPAGKTVRAMAQSNSILVAANNDTTMMWSEDGKDWHPSTSAPLITITYVCYASGKFFASGGAGDGTYYSSNGKTWNYIANLPRATKVVYANGINVAISEFQGGLPYFSFNGYDWYAAKYVNHLDDANTYALDVHNGLFVLSNAYGVFYSVDGNNWTISDIKNTSWYVKDFAYGNGAWVATRHATSSAASSIRFISYSSIDDFL